MPTCKVKNIDNIAFMKTLKPKSVDFVLTDIPYDECSRQDNGLRNFNFEQSDIITFDLDTFLDEVYRITSGSILIFCGFKQVSKIFDYFDNKQGTARVVIWEKSNPSPINGQYVYLSGIETAVWFKRKGSKNFNAHCKNTVFRFPLGNRTWNPTGKNLKLFEDLVLDNSNEGQTIFDPCMGGATSAVAAIKHNRNFIGCELNTEFYNKTLERLAKENIQVEEI